MEGAAVFVEDLSLLFQDENDGATDRNDAQGLVRRVEDEGSPQQAGLLPPERMGSSRSEYSKTESLRNQAIQAGSSPATARASVLGRMLPARISSA
jgi:hypothetical protein